MRQTIGVKATALHFLDTKNENDTDEASNLNSTQNYPIQSGAGIASPS